MTADTARSAAVSKPGPARSGMSKTRAGRLARQARQYGYFDMPEGLRVNCPLCREHVTAIRGYREFPARPGKPASVRPDGTRYVFRQERSAEALDRTVTRHLMHWCTAAPEGRA